MAAIPVHNLNLTNAIDAFLVQPQASQKPNSDDSSFADSLRQPSSLTNQSSISQQDLSSPPATQTGKTDRAESTNTSPESTAGDAPGQDQVDQNIEVDNDGKPDTSEESLSQQSDSDEKEDAIAIAAEEVLRGLGIKAISAPVPSTGPALREASKVTQTADSADSAEAANSAEPATDLGKAASNKRLLPDAFISGVNSLRQVGQVNSKSAAPARKMLASDVATNLAAEPSIAGADQTELSESEADLFSAVKSGRELKRDKQAVRAAQELSVAHPDASTFAPSSEILSGKTVLAGSLIGAGTSETATQNREQQSSLQLGDQLAQGNPDSTNTRAESLLLARLPQQLVGHASESSDRSIRTGPDQQRFVERVARALQAAEGRGGHLRLRLHPPELGALRLDVQVRGGVMHARIEAEQSAARTMLMDGLPMLRERLAEQGIRVEQFDVGVLDQRAGGEQTHFGDPQSNHRQPLHQDHGGTAVELEDAKSSDPLSINHAGKINVIV